MDLADYYRVLGLRSGASYEEIKASYRRLARRYHPDANPANQQLAQDKFIQLTEAYKILTSVVQPIEQTQQSPSASRPESRPDRPEPRSDSRSESRQDWKPAPKVQVRVTRKAPSVQFQDLSATDQKLKSQSYQQLQQLLKQQRFPRAITLIEGLAQRLPNDAEVRQWQAITYQRFGRYLISSRQSEKARMYLKKALRTDPHNKSLWYEVERDFRRIEQIEIY